MSALNISDYTQTLGRQAKQAASLMAKASTATKNQALLLLAKLLRENVAALQVDNAKDIERAVAAGLSAPMVDRLKLTPKVIETCAQGCEQLAAMADVIGEVTALRQQPSGIRVGQMRVPIGVFGMIFESRPNVTIEASSLSIKSGNACILRGGSEAIDSNKALAKLVQQALLEAGLPANAVQLVQTTDREVVGNSHTYVDEPCDMAMALNVADNAKTNKYSPCNATESLLVARGVAADFLPQIASIYAAKGVEMRCDAEALALLQAYEKNRSLAQTKTVSDATNNVSSESNPPPLKLVAAQESDWFEEYLAPIISIKMVDGVDEAIAHINQYSSHHTDAILTTDHLHAQAFLREVDSASVMVNTSTRFADGFEYGLGAEIGISTDKFHARGPVGIEGLTSLKYVVLGEGEVRA